jgi:hypothetical protein
MADTKPAPNSPADRTKAPTTKATRNNHRGNSERHHWLEYASFGLAGAALLVSACAAAFSGWQAWIASDTEERQLRAYLELTDIEVVCPDCTTTGPANPEHQNLVHIRFENSGQTPAREIRYKISWWPIASKNAPLNFEFPDYSPSGPTLVSTSELAQGKNRDGVGGIGDIEPFRMATTGASTLYLYGHLDYCDVFGKPRATGFCFIYVPNVGEKLPLCDRHNGEIEPHHSCG